MAKKVLFPLESCFIFDKRDRSWFELMFIDAAYLHIMVFTTSSYFEWVRGRNRGTRGPDPMLHLLKAVRLLREKLHLGDEEIQTSISTILVVLALTGHAHFMGDDATAKHHLRGLREIVSLRGGIATFRDTPKLMIEILRYVPHWGRLVDQV